ncbi:GGDEF domain-containing protein [Vibrio litoralis]|uniref:GGDEF domain-containing protein n=1 Tax=Vibrio litoralis TaxID=335972 RepID=UPI0006856FAA|nr:GGDEF domain-containing protein [Vibrio litoralis]
MLNKLYIKVVLVIIVLNVFLSISYYFFGHDKTLEMSPKVYPYKVASDSVVGGNSQVSLNLDSDTPTMSCRLVKSDYPWPYCEMTITLSDDVTQGVDLSGYDRVFLDIDYQGVQENTAKVRVNIRNYEPKVFDPKDDNTLKYNGIEYHAGFAQGGKEIGYDKFQVLTWWLFDYNVAIEESGVKVDNVSMIQIATDSGSVLGDHTITVNKIIFKGDYLSPQAFAFVLLSTWIVAALIFLFYELFQSRKRVLKMAAHAENLNQLNKDLETKYSEVSLIATKDELTGACNRRAIREWLDNLARRVRWGSSRLSMIYVDLDHFKAVNDTFGHNVGDQVLREFAELVYGKLREDDRLVRWGGEEFIIFCPNSDIEGASQVAERIRSTVESYQWPEVGILTCSFGVTEMAPGEGVTEMIARADEALYHAKRNGRNRVEVLKKLI